MEKHVKQVYSKSSNQEFLDKLDLVDSDIRDKWSVEQLNLTKLFKESNPDKDFYFKIKYVGGLDISFSKHFENKAIVGLVVMDFTTKKIVYENYKKVTMTQPYVPSFLAFREKDFYYELLDILKNCPNYGKYYPDLLIFDGNGIMHPRQCGIAVHAGVELGIPSIGCAKTVYAIDGISVLKAEGLSQKLKSVGQFVKLTGKSGKVWGCLLKTCLEEDPIIVSIGHLIDLTTSINVVLRLLSGVRVPEPINTADKITRIKIRKDDKIELLRIENKK